ncbi:uncharacterized protein THITE_2058307 [Thermothielavioides terrestris NRRL 8126]|uniref:Uncharacterized protein n=1 Tax=Thermothielavioides terrestris (strain ATCC 38088 / NRRL 8126) TaxID=578455 RepID=G2RGL0_THETT|nr:uncharacterized protein THITE_2058307 [Thermothielavioides terrestris NRRL 8126]AEO71899.1 hypothetical protein THITE_2058307 [Thermothielavioides terrestris NRRL 8126]
MAEDYEPVPLLDEERDSEKGAWKRRLSLEALYRTRPVRRVVQHWVWIGHAVLLSISITLFALAFCMRYARPSDLVITKQVSTYLGDMMISEDEVKRLGLPLNSLKITDPKTGKVGYRAAIEVFHQLHCLNLLRQFTWKEYYLDEDGDINYDEEDVRGHVDHCLETLRMNLMCQADIGVFTFKLYPELGDDDPWPDFSTLHTCRNFEDIRNWARSRAVTWDDNA